MKKAVGYARLSKDDGSRYSSIEAQVQLIEEFAEKHNLKLVHIYVDDNVSGFIPIEDRPQFNQMLEDIKQGKAEVIIAKDLSRIGRKNGVTQTLLDDWKSHGINLLLMQEMGREFNLLEDDDDLVGLSTWWNERYIKDLSKKVKTGMNVQQRNGLLIQGFYYGYKKDLFQKGKIYVNEDVKDCVKLIFDLYEQGYGMRKICYILNTEYDFPTPTEVIEQQVKEKGKIPTRKIVHKWNMHNISRIIQDEIYTGTLITHKKELKAIKGYGVAVPKDERYRFENHHEAIITKEQFDRVQEVLKKNKTKTANYNKGKFEYIFGGFIVCGECGYGGTGVSRVRSTRPDYIPTPVYECSMYRKYGSERCCNHNIKETYILENFKTLLKGLRKEYKHILDGINLETVETKSQKNIKKLEYDLQKAKEEYKAITKEKIRKIATNAENQEIIRETYLSLENECIEKIKKLEFIINKNKKEDNKIKTKKIKKAIDYFDEIIKSDKPDKAVMNEVLDKILIYHDKTIEFKLKVDINKLI